MKLLGFNFTKFDVEKFSNNKEGVKINREIEIPNIKESNPGMVNVEGKVLSIEFKDILNYKPDFAKIRIDGKMVVSVDEETGKDVLEKWESGSIPNEFRTKVINGFIKKTDLKALQFEEELSIPLHLRLSRAKVNE